MLDTAEIVERTTRASGIAPVIPDNFTRQELQLLVRFNDLFKTIMAKHTHLAGHLPKGYLRKIDSAGDGTQGWALFSDKRLQGANFIFGTLEEVLTRLQKNSEYKVGMTFGDSWREVPTGTYVIVARQELLHA